METLYYTARYTTHNFNKHIGNSSIVIGNITYEEIKEPLGEIEFIRALQDTETGSTRILIC